MKSKAESKERQMRQNESLQEVAVRVAWDFIQDESLRTFATVGQAGNVRRSTLELGLVESERGSQFLEVRTWGYDCEAIKVPADWQELIRRKMWLQMTEQPNGADKVFLRYCFEVMREYERVAEVA